MRTKIIVTAALLTLSLPAFASAEVFLIPPPATTTATTSKKGDENLLSSTTIKKIVKEEDALATLAKVLSDSLALVQEKITILKKAGADVSLASKYAGNAKVLLDGALASILNTKPDSSLPATATPAMLRAARDEKRKTIKANLVIAHDDILKAILALKKSIIDKQRALIDDEYDIEAATTTISEAATTTAAE